MNKPKKRTKWTLCPVFPETKKEDKDIACYFLMQGYNKACDEWEKYHREAVRGWIEKSVELEQQLNSLPNEDEITNGEMRNNG